MLNRLQVTEQLKVFNPGAREFVQTRIIKDSRQLKTFWSTEPPREFLPSRDYYCSPALRVFGKNILTGTWCLWADIDCKDLNFRGLEPTLILATTHGFHCYWALLECERDNISEPLKRLAHFVGGDIKSTDSTRFLRWQNSPGKDGIPIALINFTPELTYSIADFMALPQSPALTVGYRRGGGDWYFFQSQQPYAINTSEPITAEYIPQAQKIEIFTLGGSHLLWAGLAGNAPRELCGFLTEFRKVSQ